MINASAVVTSQAMRAQLIMNPEARGVRPHLQRIIHSALSSRFKLEATETRARDEAIDLAAVAVDSGAELVIAFGGDGLVNEVVNGVAGSDAAIAIIPGGTMNVFARNVGIPRDPLEATDLILARAGEVAPRTMSLGKANDRFFTFACGAGFDAEAAARVEAHRSTKRRFGEPYFYAAAMAVFLRTYFDRDPFLLVETASTKIDAVMAIGLTAGPYAYLAGRPVRLTEGVRSADELDLFVLRKLTYGRVPTYGLGALVTGRFGKDSRALRDIGSYSVSAQAPFAVHVDGEPVEPVASLVVNGSAATIGVLV